jgi:hypothetical protein
LEFGEIWLVASMLHIIAGKNKLPEKGNQKFEFPLKLGFGLIL